MLWIAIYLAWVVQKVDNTIHGINLYPVNNMVCLLTLLHWIVVYPVNNVMQPSNNWGQVDSIVYPLNDIAMYEEVRYWEHSV